MSAGKFVKSSYEEDNGTIHPIKVQPETLTTSLGGAPNVVPSTAGDNVVRSKISAKVSKTNKEIGLRPRMVAITFPPVDGAQPDGYAVGATVKIPVLDKDTWDGLSEGDSATYLTKAGRISSTIPENIR